MAAQPHATTTGVGEGDLGFVLGGAVDAFGALPEAVVEVDLLGAAVLLIVIIGAERMLGQRETRP